MPTKQVKLDGKILPVREFKMDWFVDDPAICMIAKRGSGKSYVCRSILNHYKSIPGGIVICKTERLNGFYGHFVPELYIHYEYKSEIIEQLLYRQGLLRKKAEAKEKLGKKIDPRVFLVMDDCLASKGTWATDPPVMEIFYNGRHFKIMYILTMQFPLGIKPELRCNFDYIFLLYDDFYSNQKRIYDHYAGMFTSFEIFRRVFLQLTEDHGCMVIVNRGSRRNLLDKVFFYKAPDKDISVVGSRQYKEFNTRNYDPEWEKRGEFVDVNKLMEKKKK